jgi:hypothetical protein
MSDERRYFPPSIIGVEKRAISGNLCRIHSTIRMTPAMRAGISKKALRVADLVAL